MTHREEVEFGRRIGHEILTAYRCAHNHAWYILGPHIWCTCNRRIGELPPGDRVLCVRGGGWSVDHPCSVDCERRGHPGYRHSRYIEAIRCRCGARTKGLARFDRPTLRAAAAAHTIGGLHAARHVFGMGSPQGPYAETVSHDPADAFAEDFPSNLTHW